MARPAVANAIGRQNLKRGGSLEQSAGRCQVRRFDCPAESRCGVAVDFKRAADLYANRWTLRQIGAELGVTATTVSHQLHRASVTMRRGSPPAHLASTQQIRGLRDGGLTWNEVVTGRHDGFRCLEAVPERPATKALTLGPLAAGAHRRS